MLGIPEFIAVPAFVPGVIVSVLLGYIIRRPVARWLDASPMVTWVAIISFGTIISATLTPLNGVDANGGVLPPGCDFSRVGLAPLDDLLQVDDVSLNILLFIPFGASLSFLPISHRMEWLIAAAVALPFIIETTQLLVAPLDRACQSGDVVDNLSGLLIGLAIGSIARALGRVVRMRRRRST